MKRFLFWLRNARYHTYKQSLIAGLIAILLVSDHSNFNPLFGLLAIFGAVLAHMGANLLDDYFDYKSDSVRARQEMLDGGMRARSQKCHYLQNGSTTDRALLAVGLSTCAVALALGFFLWTVRGNGILICAVFGAFLAFFYSAPPFRLSFHGLGELTVGLLFGPVLMAGVALAACGKISNTVWFASISVGLLVANILYTHSILDYDPDKRANKKTLAVLLGSVRNAVGVSLLFLSTIYLSIIAGVWLGFFSVWELTVLGSLPLALTLWRLLRLHVTDPNDTVPRKWWMGPMEYWQFFVQEKIDWFMIRWYLSRNLLTAFCALFILGFCIDRWMTC